MKRRSLRLPRVETHDDWVDESWTVDCLCGVDFDDGKEMVDCDKCRVWVHTSCSGYVKGDKSFVCDRCKGRNRSSKNNYSVETEVAQLLVDLPNKDFRRGKVNSINAPSRKPGNVLYTEVCTEKKVHVHGVPGGDPSLFAGLSSVFSPQLWKCTGYVPKKFNFQYKEFPSLDEKETEEVERRNNNEDTAGVLVSLLKDSAMVAPLGSSKDVECLVEHGTTGKGAKIEHIKSGGNEEPSFAKNAVEKNSRLPLAAVVDSLKHKKKDRDTSKDHRERKRYGRHEKGKYSKKKASISSTTGISTNNDRKHAAANVHDVETKKFDSSRCCTNRDGRLKEDSTGDQREFKVENSHKVNQVVGGILDSPNVNGRGSAQRIMEFQKEQPEVEHLVVASPEPVDSKKIQGLIGDARCFVPNVGVKTGADGNRDALNVHHSPSSEEKLKVLKSSALIEAPAAINLTEEARANDLLISKKNVCASNAHSVGPGLLEKSERTSHPDSQPSSKVNAFQKQPPASSNPLAALRDEQLALLLHQELNSSPRVPRVPRMLTKRTTSSGGKDFISSSRKKESGKDGAVSAPDVSDEAKKVERVSPPPNHRRQYSEITTDDLAKGKVESGIPKDLPRKNKPPASTATTSSGLSSSTEVNEQKVSSTRHTSDGDSGAVGRPTPLTLPGLIAKIMSKGERMTLKELCDTVLPHWPHLRKNNGERYAYSIHSQGVLDCLRNHSEWARLVDRGPKESGKDGAVGAPDVSNEAKKIERVSPPPNRIPKDLPRKNKPPASTATTSSGLSSSTEENEQRESSTRNSPRHTSDGDSGPVRRPTPLTLPGLIAKIMNKGERMTLKELCDTVLPHWPHLRKNNGDRYAYSSHSQGVLDCLRNRTEWARLVDRGPKTSARKKRRKPDPDVNSSGAESEDDDTRERTAKDGRSKSLESHRDEFPKGKRNARKRRRLSLHDVCIKENMRRNRAEVVSDDGDDSLSNSSGDNYR